MTENTSDLPPSYDVVTGQASSSQPFPSANKGPQHLTNVQATSQPWRDSKDVGPSSGPPAAGPSHGSSYNDSMVYHYINPRTGERIVSLLPPNHPQMVCVQEGRHKTETKYGVLGILAAIIWFPLGIGFCLLDRKVRCTRCGQVLNHGICG